MSWSIKLLCILYLLNNDPQRDLNSDLTVLVTDPFTYEANPQWFGLSLFSNPT